MKPVSVNLLPRRQKWYLRQRQVARWLQGGSFGLAGVYAVLLVVLFSWRLVVASQTKTVERRIDQARREIATLAEIESQQVLVKSKLARLVQVRQARVEFASLLGKLIALFPEAVRLGDVMVKSAGAIEISGRTFDAVALAEVLERVQDPDKVGEFLQQVSLESVSKSSVGEYAFTLSLVPKQSLERGQ